MNRPPANFKKWRFWKRWFGRRSEKAAAKFLRKNGYRVLAANIADRRGELDLLCLSPDRKLAVIVEVRSTSTADPQLAADSVDPKKQKHIADATLRFLSRHRLHGLTYRFDIIAMAWPTEQREPKVLHIEQAFEAPGQFQFFS